MHAETGRKLYEHPPGRMEEEQERQRRRGWDEWHGSKMPMCRALHQSSALTSGFALNTPSFC